MILKVIPSWRLLLLVSLLWLEGILSAVVHAQPAWTPTHQLEAAVLHEDWSTVITLLPLGEASPASAKLVKAHALLAENRNNEALCLFLRVSSADELRQWQTWTQDFVKKYSHKPVAHYLRGDALTRLEQWDEALNAFGTALSLHPEHPLVLHARGVAYASKGEIDNARQDFSKATETPAGSKLAELRASRGTYILQRKTNAKIALEWFEQALQLSPDYVLALNGQGSTWILLHDLDKAEAALQAAKTRTPACLSEIRGVVDLNLAVLVVERGKAVAKALAQVAGIEPGFSLDEKIKILDRKSPVERQLGYDILNNAANFNAKVQGGLLNPSKIEVGFSGGMKGALVGPQPYLEGKVTAALDFAGKANFNANQQTQLMDAMRQRYEIRQANPIGNFSAWTLQHLSPKGDYGKLTSPQGVSSREIGDKPVDSGDWNVFTLYGLVYRIKASANAPVERGR